MGVLHYERSYVTWTIPHNPNDKRVPGHKPWGNSARILFDARCVLTEDATGKSEEFFLVVPCRTEWMYQERNMIQKPSGEYRAMHSRERYRSVGLGMTAPVEAARSIRALDVFSAYEITVNEYPTVTPLTTDQAVVDATLAGLPIIAQNEIHDHGFTALLEYPVKTMNFLADRVRFQVDTGPLLLPDFSATHEHWIDRLLMAETVYNTFDWAEFVARAPTPLVVDGREVATVLHYSDYRAYPARTTFYAAGRL